MVSQRRFLLKKRFEYVWLQQENVENVENDQLFLEIFQSRVKELFYNKWRHRVENSSKLSIYSTFKNASEWEVYLNTGIIKMSKVRAALTRFRCSSHVLNIGLYNVISYSNFREIMTAKNVDLIQDLAYYVYYSFELKNTPAVV